MVPYQVKLTSVPREINISTTLITIYIIFYINIHSLTVTFNNANRITQSSRSSLIIMLLFTTTGTIRAKDVY